METLGDKIRRLRSERKVSQGELAEGIGVSRQTVSKWESDVTRPNMESIRSLCGYFSVDVSIFIDEVPQECSPAAQFRQKERALLLSTRKSHLFGRALTFAVLFMLSAFGCFVCGAAVLPYCFRDDIIYYGNNYGLSFWHFTAFGVLAVLFAALAAVHLVRYSKVKIMLTEIKEDED